MSAGKLTIPVTKPWQAPCLYCVDTLSFDQWLQFVLIPRMEQLVMLQAPLPTSVSLYPMASEVYKEDLAEAEALLRLIARFDLLLSGKVIEQ